MIRLIYSSRVHLVEQSCTLKPSINLNTASLKRPCTPLANAATSLEMLVASKQVELVKSVPGKWCQLACCHRHIFGLMASRLPLHQLAMWRWALNVCEHHFIPSSLHVRSNRSVCISIVPHPHLYTRVTLLCQASAVLLSCLEYCRHTVWRHSSTAQWTLVCQQQNLTWSIEAAVTARPLLIIMVLTAPWMYRHDASDSNFFSFRKHVSCVFLPSAHPFRRRRHVWLRRHQNYGCRAGFVPARFYDAAVMVCPIFHLWYYKKIPHCVSDWQKRFTHVVLTLMFES